MEMFYFLDMSGSVDKDMVGWILADEQFTWLTEITFATKDIYLPARPKCNVIIN
jgi:hypothetical protein